MTDSQFLETRAAFALRVKQLHDRLSEQLDAAIVVGAVAYPGVHLLEHHGVLGHGLHAVVVVVPDHRGVGVDREQVGGVAGLGRRDDAVEELDVGVAAGVSHAGDCSRVTLISEVIGRSSLFSRNSSDEGLTASHSAS